MEQTANRETQIDDLPTDGHFELLKIFVLRFIGIFDMNLCIFVSSWQGQFVLSESI